MHISTYVSKSRKCKNPTPMHANMGQACMQQTNSMHAKNKPCMRTICVKYRQPQGDLRLATCLLLLGFILLPWSIAWSQAQTLNAVHLHLCWCKSRFGLTFVVAALGFALCTFFFSFLAFSALAAFSASVWGGFHDLTKIFPRGHAIYRCKKTLRERLRPHEPSIHLHIFLRHHHHQFEKLVFWFPARWQLIVGHACNNTHTHTHTHEIYKLQCCSCSEHFPQTHIASWSACCCDLAKLSRACQCQAKTSVQK